jgi:2-polyprenyl-6-methoxyphenol hydroxylase-like FAD-dependent oxidoreductase
MPSPSIPASRAIVVGGGIGGMAVASALARHVASVTLLERDEGDAHPGPRPGVPQGRHVHGLLMGGLNALEHLYPGFDAALADAGAVRLRIGLDARLEQPGFDPFPARDLGAHSYAMSRPLIEHVVRQFVARDARIHVRPGCPVREIVASPDGSVRGVRVRGEDEPLEADLVVDASGRGALTLDFLAAHGQAAPEEAVIPVDIRYTCAVFELRPDPRRDWKALLVRPVAGGSRRAIVYPLEGGARWIVGLGGAAGDSAPTDLDGFLAYAKTLRTPTAHDALRDATLVGDIVRFAFPQSQRRYFERLPGLPAGLLPVGDAICRMNPSFGQGMSVVAKEACLVDAILADLVVQSRPMADLGPAFLAALPSVLDDPWNTVGQDYAYPHLEGLRPAGFARTQLFGAALNRLAAADAAVHRLVTDIAHLVRPASALREGDLMDRVAAEMLVG